MLCYDVFLGMKSSLSGEGVTNNTDSLIPSGKLPYLSKEKCLFFHLVMFGNVLRMSVGMNLLGLAIVTYSVKGSAFQPA